MRYQALARLREGVWECPKLPFLVNDLSALIGIEDGMLTIKHAQGSNGLTTLRAEGTLGIDDPKHRPLDLRVDLIDLELDQRLRDRTPPEYDELWDVFKPRGRVNAALHVVRGRAGQPVDLSATVLCRDVAAVYRHFPYPLDHLTGGLTLEKKMLTVDLQTVVGGQPMRLTGTIQNPGVDAVVELDILAESVPIDDVLRKAMPPDVRKVVDQFHPRGVVKAHARVYRKPMAGPNARPEGLLAIDAEIDLREGCEITWDRLPYPIRNLRGRLEVHPDRWVFKNMRGKNGQAIITASGSVEKLHPPKLPNGDDPLKIDVYLQAQKLPFSGELKEALPPAWRKSWPTINPSGASDVEAEVHVAPDRPDHTHIVIAPLPESNVRLEVTRSPQPPLDPGGTIELPMEDVRGRFVFDDGKVTMHDVNFKFRGAPVKFSRGTVFLEDTGRFELNVNDLWVEEIRFDTDLRKKMPPLMAQFALRLDDGRTFRARGDLQIGWTGVKGEPAWCKWKNTLVVFNDNTVKTGIPLEHIQGQLDHVSGWSNGVVLEVQGILKLDSVSLLGQQITQLESPFHIKKGWRSSTASAAGSWGARSWPAMVLDQPRRHAALPRGPVAPGGPAPGIRPHDPGPAVLPRQYQRPDRAQRPGQRRPEPPRPRRGPHHPGRPGRAPARAAVRQRAQPLRQHEPRDARPASHSGQDGVRLGRRRIHDRARRDDLRPDQVHRQRLQPAGPGNDGPSGQPRPSTQRPLGPRPIPLPPGERFHPRGQYAHS